MISLMCGLLLVMQKLWAVCDLAMGLILSKTRSFEMKEFPSEPRIPPMYFKKHEDPNFVNGETACLLLSLPLNTSPPLSVPYHFTTPPLLLTTPPPLLHHCTTSVPHHCTTSVPHHSGIYFFLNPQPSNITLARNDEIYVFLSLSCIDYTVVNHCISLKMSSMPFYPFLC